MRFVCAQKTEIVRNLAIAPPVVLIKEEVVPKAQPPVFRRISEMLHDQFHEVACEPLPKRWIDLIKLLNEKERQQSSAEVIKR